jgi:hypothetical protein
MQFSCVQFCVGRPTWRTRHDRDCRIGMEKLFSSLEFPLTQSTAGKCQCSKELLHHKCNWVRGAEFKTLPPEVKSLRAISGGPILVKLPYYPPHHYLFRAEPLYVLKIKQRSVLFGTETALSKMSSYGPDDGVSTQRGGIYFGAFAK